MQINTFQDQFKWNKDSSARDHKYVQEKENSDESKK